MASTTSTSGVEGPTPSTASLVGLTEAQRSKAQERYQLLRPHLEDGVPLTRLVPHAGQSCATLYRWAARYREHGLAGLARDTRSDRGFRHLPEPLLLLIEGLALQKTRPSARSIHRRVKLVAVDRGWSVPSYRTVAEVVEQLSPALKTLAHEGPRAYGEAFDLLYRREATGPNEIWQADHTPLDIWVFDEHGKPGRPWFTAIIDDYSRAIAGWRLSFQAPSALQTALTLRQAIWRKQDPRWHVCGIPVIFYTDHGSDFTSQHMEQVAADLKIQLVFSAVGEPRGRGRIERFFRVVNQLFLCLQPGYSPPKAPKQKPVLTLVELEERLGKFLLDEYHQRVHIETKCAPQERWETGGFLPRLPESLEQLDLLLLTVARSRLVQRDGIRFQGLRYMATTLAAYVGETVTVRYDPRDVSEIRVFFEDHFLCRAICSELAGESVSLKEVIQARRSRRRVLRQKIKARADVVQELLQAKGATDIPPALPPPKTASRKAEPKLKRYRVGD